MRNLMWCLFFFLLSFTVAAAELPTVVQADFTQTRFLKDLEIEIKITGSMVYERNGRIRWQVKTPVRSVTIIGKDFLQHYDADTGKVAELKGRDASWVKLLHSSFSDWLSGDMEKLAKNQDCTVLKISDYVFKFTARNAKNAFFKTLTITFNEKQDGIRSVLLEEPNGDTMTIEFHSVKNDPVLPDTIWKAAE